MPELPEVETVLRTLEKQILNIKVVAVKLLYDRIIDYPRPKEFIKALVGQSFRTFKRRGKYLIFELDDYNLIVHLRMEGKFFLLNEKEKYNKHDHVVLTLNDKSELRYNDVRKFGRMYLYLKDEKMSCLDKLGYEFFDKEMSADYLMSIAENSKLNLKQLLLNQELILGVGNIYADEICFRVNKHPRTLIKELNRQDFVDLIKAGKEILKQAIKAGGTTIRSYTSSLGISGRFQLSLKVHGLQGKNCSVCNSIILKDKVAGRGTYYCPNCQKFKYYNVAITGRRASGKSSVLAIMKELGFSVVDADKLVDNLLKKRAVLDKIENILNIKLDKSHLANKKTIASCIFNDDLLKKEYENYIHPLIQIELTKNKGSFTIAEVQRLFESDFQRYFDATVTVISTVQQEKQRLLEKGVEISDIVQREKYQAKNTWLISRANFILYNNGDKQQLRKEVEKLAKILKGEDL